jgi:colicin import membrane protein
MNASAAARSPFDPPRSGGLGPSLALALAAHLALALALTWALRWNSQPQNLAVQAELWAPAVQQAAPPPPPPEPPPAPEPPAPELPPPPPQPTAEEQREAEIALEQKKQAEQERQLALERQRKEQELAQERQRQELAAQKAAEEAKRKEQLAKAEAAKKAEADKRAETARRMDALRRMTALAGADHTGQDARNAGPSGDYAARIRALVHDAVRFPGTPPGNPTVIVEVRTSPTGEIINLRTLQPSGVKAWDEAVLRALDRIRKLPSDKGRYWTPMEVKVSPLG